MHDIRLIRDDPAAFDAALARRGVAPVSAALLEIDAKRRACIAEAETALADRNAASKQVGAAKAAGDEAEFERLRALVAEKKEAIGTLEMQAKHWDEKLQAELMTIPNLPHADAPDGADEEDNVELRRWGTPAEFAFDPKEHFEISAVQPHLDLALGAKLSGARFMTLAGPLARLHRALAQFMLDTHITEHGLTEMWTPVLVREEMMLGTGQLPKFGEDSYQTTNGWWLIPTSEVTLTNTAAEEIVDEAALPRRMTAWTQCFRSEAGSAGRDVAGILRQHQFEKVEMVTICRPEEGLAELDRMTDCAETILKKLDLPFRTVALCTGDMGFGARKTFDIEVWLPGQNTYREISSCSVCGDFQARRMNARLRRAPKEGQKKGDLDFAHTLNGSGLAVGRSLIAVLENGQQADGSVRLPEALAPYLGGASLLTAEGLR